MLFLRVSRVFYHVTPSLRPSPERSTPSCKGLVINYGEGGGGYKTGGGGGGKLSFTPVKMVGWSFSHGEGGGGHTMLWGSFYAEA